MVKVETLMDEGKLSRINELELGRYVNFFSSSYRNNLDHCRFVLTSFPRWSIISGYYAMHDITKLLLAKEFRLKVDFEVHATTIKVLSLLVKNKEIISLIKKGHGEFISLANDLAEAKKERVKVQYYTGTKFLEEEYRRRAKLFLDEVVGPYLKKMSVLVGGLG